MQRCQLCLQKKRRYLRFIYWNYLFDSSLLLGRIRELRTIISEQSALPIYLFLKLFSYWWHFQMQQSISGVSFVDSLLSLLKCICIRKKQLLLCLCTALVSFGKVTPEQKREVEKFGLAIYSWDEFLQVVGYSFHVLLLFFYSYL